MFFRKDNASTDGNTDPEGSSSFISREAVESLEKGSSKLDVYGAFYGRMDDDSLGRLLASYPDRSLYKKYRGLNTALGVLLSFITLIKLVNLILYIHQTSLSLLHILWAAPLGLIINLLLIYFVVRKIGISYRLLGIFVILMTLFRASESLGRMSSSADFISFYLITGLSLLSSILFIFLGYRMFPYLGFFKTRRDINGRIIYTVEDMNPV